MSDIHQETMFEGAKPALPKPKGREKFKKPIVMFGLGPEGKTCKTCHHHISHRMSKTYHKCTIWYISWSEATDIRLSWPACGRYEEEMKDDGC